MRHFAFCGQCGSPVSVMWFDDNWTGRCNECKAVVFVEKEQVSHV